MLQMLKILKFTLAIAMIAPIGLSAAKKQPFYDQSQLSGIKDYKKFAEGKDVLFLSKDNKTDYSIYVDANASSPEKFAAQTLADYLKRITNVDFPVVNSVKNTKKIIAVGPGAVTKIASGLVPKFSKLGNDGIIIKVDGQNIILTGAQKSRRGTIYAVVTFLEQIGCRWWTESATFVPQKPDLKIPEYNIEYKPVPNQRLIFDYYMRNYAVYNKLNGNCYKISEDHGGKVTYKGPFFVHTFSLIVPPKKYFAAHPEWYPLINGKRKAGDWDGKITGHINECQLCLSNKELQAFVIEKVKDYLADAPPDSIVSLSQSDGNGGNCQCAECTAIEKEEGGPSGPILRFANTVADAIKGEYPHATIETTAYCYSQKPPSITKPRDNVQVMLCAYRTRRLANYDSPANKEFYNDFIKWSKLTHNIQVWDYTTDFTNYISPFPNLYVTAHNIRICTKNNVKGILLQGTYNTNGGDMKALKNWVFAKLMWNPNLDEKELVKEFIHGYYKEAAPYISKYFELLYAHDPMQQYYKRFSFLKQAYSLFAKGRKAVKNNSIIRRRFELAFAPVLNTIMTNWAVLKQECAGAKSKWPFPDTPNKVANEFVRICGENNVDYANEHKLSPEKWAAKYRVAPKVAKEATEFKNVAADDKLDIQDSAFRLYNKGKWTNIVKDNKASDGSAASTPGNHNNWAIQVDLPGMPKKTGASGKWKVYTSARIIKQGDKGAGSAGFCAGIYDLSSRKIKSRCSPKLKDCKSDDYKLHLVGSVVPGSKYIYIVPYKNPGVKEVRIDRIILVRDR